MDEMEQKMDVEDDHIDGMDDEASDGTKKIKIDRKAESQFDFQKIMNDVQSELDSAIKDMESHIISSADSEGDSILFPTGNPYLDIHLCGGIPKNRMTYVWGVSGTGKTTLSFQIASSIFRQSVINGTKDDYVFIFIDSEEGQAKKWLDRIKVVVPMKTIIPKSIESIKDILEVLHKKFSRKNIIVIWDSVIATPPAMITGRGDTARAVSSLLRDLQFTNMNITLISINQFREKQDIFAAPEPPGGNFLRHKSHLTLFAKSISKSKFFSKRPELGRSVLFGVTKSRDGFSGIDFRLEMTQYSGFDAVLSTILALKEFGFYTKRRGPHKLDIPEKFSLEYLDKDANTLVCDIDLNDLFSQNVSCHMEFDDIKDLYEFLCTKESHDVWRVFIMLTILKTYKQHFLSDEEFYVFVKNLYEKIVDNYLKSDIINALTTRIDFS